jgi:hypothetical protein
MRTSTAAVARALTGVAALILIGIGLGTLLWRWHVSWMREWIDRVDQSWFDRAPHAGWWAWSLAALAILAAAAGFSALVVLLRPNRVPDIVLPGVLPGRISLDVNDIAAAAASDLAADRRIRDATGRALNDGSRVIVRLTMVVDPLTSAPELEGLLTRVARRVQAAVGPNLLPIEYLVHVDGSETKSRNR